MQELPSPAILRRRERARNWYARHRAEIVGTRTDYMREYYLRNRSRIKARDAENRGERLAKQKLLNLKNREKSRLWKLNNRDRVNACWRKRQETNVNAKIRSTLGGRINCALRARGLYKTKSTITFCGCDLHFLRGFLEARFQPGMTWENYGKWHVDHKIPCAEFDLRDPNQQLQCFHYSNLQPLWAKDNHMKSAKSPGVHQAELI